MGRTIFVLVVAAVLVFAPACELLAPRTTSGADGRSYDRLVAP